MNDPGRTTVRPHPFAGRLAVFIIVLFAAAVLCASCGGLREEGPSGQLCIASWNMQTFFDGVVSGDEFDDFKKGWTDADYRARLKTMARVIRRLAPGPDVLVVQEVENETVLRDLCGLCSSSGYVCYGAGSQRGCGIQCGFISKLPIQPGDVKTIRAVGPGQRDALQVHIDTPEGDVVVWIVHARSRRGGGQESEQARIELLRAVKEAAEEAGRRYPGAIKLIAGDFNADLESSREVDGQTALLPACDALAQEREERGSILVTGRRDIRIWPKGTWHSFWYDQDVVKDRPGSYYYPKQGRWERFDQILCSKEAFDRAGLDFSGAGVYVRWELCEADGAPDGYDLRRREGVSDHLPVWVLLDRN